MIVFFFFDMLIRLVILKLISGLNTPYKKIIFFAFLLLMARILFYEFEVILEPFYLLILVHFLKTNWTTQQKVFYSLFPFVLGDMFQRIIGLYLMFLFHETINTIHHSVISNILLTVLLIPFCYCFFKGLRINTRSINIHTNNKHFNKPFYLLNILLISYSIIIRSIIAYEIGYEQALFIWEIDTFFLRTNILLVYFILFTVFLLFINYLIKEREKKELQERKDKQIIDIENYSRHVESLYHEISNFKHDYKNILISLNSSINSKDIDSVKEIYQSVLNDSDKFLYEKNYDIARLSNINNSAIKSVISSKLIEANNNGIITRIEVEEPIDTPEIEVIDFIVILSIFLDNALEEVSGVSNGEILFAFFQEEQKKILIIENTTSIKQIDTLSIFNYGFSTKGKNRGIGLGNVKRVLDKYNNISIFTNSKNHKFTQELTFYE